MYANDPHSVRRLRQAELFVADERRRHPRDTVPSRVRDVASVVMSGIRSARWLRRGPAVIDGSNELFAGLDARSLRHIEGHFRFVDLAEGDSPVRQGEPAAEFLVVLAGSLGVTLDTVPIAILDAGSHFGAVALLDRDREPDHSPLAVASLSAFEPTRVAIAGADEFAAIIEQHPLVAQRIRTVVGRRRAYLRGHADAKAMYADRVADPFPVRVSAAG